jgi:TRAP-type C4-dicarboxylate transport system permease small subunit
VVRGGSTADGQETAWGSDIVKRLVVGASRQLNNVAMVLISIMMLHISLDVAGKFLLNAPIEGTLETVALYYMVAIVFLPLAYSTHSGGQIVVELFTRNLSKRSVQIIDGAIGLFAFAFLVLFAWQTGLEAVAKTESGEVRETATSVISIWPSRWLPVLGYGMMAVYFLIRGIEDLIGIEPEGGGGIEPT